ncbi:hypothetical protein C8K36_10755 [Rhodococcus sp. OK519]|nr:hypothetical protein C8K36_10755 [Rhodococcus sp. OK519]
MLGRDDVVGGAGGTARKDRADRTHFTHTNTAFGKARSGTVCHGGRGHQSNATPDEDGAELSCFSWYSEVGYS